MLLVKKLSILTFKRFFELTPYIIFFPKIFINQLNNLKFFNCLKYFFKYSYSFLADCNFSNLVYFLFSEKNLFYNFLKSILKDYFSFKINNLYFNSFSFTKFNYLVFFNLKVFILKIKQLFFFVTKYIYTFCKYFK